MKKLIIASSCALAIAGSAFGQGNVNWGSISFTSVTAQTNTTTYWGGSTALGVNGTVGAAGGSATLGTGYCYELLIGSVYTGTLAAAPSTFAALSAWTDSGLEATNSNNPGRLQVVNPNAGATVAALSTSVSNNIILVGWSANLGTTWGAAYANLVAGNYALNTAFFGESAVGYVEGLGTSVSPGTTLFGASAIAQGTPIYSLNTQLYLAPPVPEPTTLALAALGGASLLLFRRKK
jgi:hypothetical protein